MPELVKALTEIKKGLDTKQTITDFVTAFSSAMQTLQAMKRAADESAKDAQEKNAKLEQDFTLAVADLQSKFAALQASIPNPKDGAPGRDGAPGQDGHTPTTDELIALIRPLIPEQPTFDPVTGEMVRNELEALQGDQRLKGEAVQGFTELQDKVREVAARPLGGHSPSGPTLMVGGAKKGRALNLNFKAGSNTTVSHAFNNGQHDITIASTGGASLSPITMTGTIDDSNTSFTAASAPTFVIVNGAIYKHGAGVSISGTSINLDNPVGTGGSIFGL